MLSGTSKPAALAFTEGQLGGPCYEQDKFSQFNNIATVMADNNGDRVGLLMFNLSPVDLTIGLQGNVTVSNGLILPANGGFLSLNVRDDFTLVARQWWGIAQSGSQLYVLEIIRYRDVISDGGA